MTKGKNQGNSTIRKILKNREKWKNNKKRRFVTKCKEFKDPCK